MRQILLLIMSVALIGCGESKEAKAAKAKSIVEAKAAEEAKIAELSALEKKYPEAHVNTLGMVFKPVPGTEVSFCIWETRVKDYAAYASANVGVDESWKNPRTQVTGTISFSQADTHPVVNVSWKDANAFCTWLTKKELAEGQIKVGQKCRLPTDAEWSVAVGLGKEKGNTPEEKQGGIKDVYPWGKEWPPPKEAGNYSKRLKVDNFEYTSPVGSFAANKYGLHDLGGNVWEWCEDKYNSNSSTQWLRSAGILRGASWGFDEQEHLSSSFRNPTDQIVADDGKGFRCVLTNE